MKHNRFNQKIFSEAYYSQTVKSPRQSETFVAKCQVTYEGILLRPTDFSAEGTQARREWNIFKLLKGKKCAPRILYLAKLPFRNEGEIKSF